LVKFILSDTFFEYSQILRDVSTLAFVQCLALEILLSAIKLV
jgi:hypothetical protein